MTTISFKHSGVIQAPAEKVFAVLANPAQIPLWRKDVPSIGQISGETKEGTTFKEEVQLMGKKQLLMKVISYQPNNKLVIEAQSGMPLLPTQYFTLTAEGEHTLLDLVVHMKVSGFFILMKFLLPIQLKRIWVGYFKDLNLLVRQ
jgi:uncharacterized protein YndB with AHSA1/START domain